MCLITVLKKPIVADKDLTVYKILEKRGGVYYAPYKPEYIYGHVNIPVIPASEDLYSGCEVEFYGCGSTPKKMKGKVITGGYLHAYISYKDARETSDKINNEYYYFSQRYKVVEMTVPKGAKYYQSYDNKEICADTLIWEECEKIN